MCNVYSFFSWIYPIVIDMLPSLATIFIGYFAVTKAMQRHKESLRDKRKEAVDLKQQEKAVEIIDYLEYVIDEFEYVFLSWDINESNLRNANKKYNNSKYLLNIPKKFSYMKVYFGLSFYAQLCELDTLFLVLAGNLCIDEYSEECKKAIIKKYKKEKMKTSVKMLEIIDNIKLNLSKYIVADVKEWED